MSTLEVSGVTKRFTGLTAVDEASFGAAPGRVTSVIGPNGAGKTTLFNVITGFLRPDAGRVTYGRYELTSLTPPRIARLGVVRTFQDVRIFERLTVDENLEIGARADGLRHARDLLREFTQGELAGDALAGSLGYAQQKLVAIARGVAAQAEAVLLDEPAAGLDDASMRRLESLLGRLRDEGRLILLVEHKMDFVMRLSDTVVVLAAGRVIASGPPAAIQADESVIAAYLGTAHSPVAP